MSCKRDLEQELCSHIGMMEAILIVHAAAAGNASKVEMLLSEGARVDARDRGFTPLLVAAQRGHTKVCKVLLETGKASV